MYFTIRRLPLYSVQETLSKCRDLVKGITSLMEIFFTYNYFTLKHSLEKFSEQFKFPILRGLIELNLFSPEKKLFEEQSLEKLVEVS